MRKGDDDRLERARALIDERLVGEAVARAGFVVLVADEQMRYLAASDAACELLGYSRAELLELSVPDVVVESNAAALYDEFVRDRVQHGTITLRRKDGETVEAAYDARETLVNGLRYYVSVLTPAQPGRERPS